MIALQGRGAAALDERFNHIDTEHFKKGDRQSDWCFPQTKDLGGLSGTGQNLMDQSEHVSMGSKGNGRKRKLAA